MEPTIPSPDPTGRPSSMERRDGSSNAPSELPITLPKPDPNDETPTIISMNRTRGVSPETIESLTGKRLGHFELIEPIGVGGMAAVIRARDLQLDRTVALKILPPEMAVDPENISRFNQEARAAAKLDHENVARVYYCGEDQGLHFIAFEYVEGVDLRTIMNRGGPLSVDAAIRYMLQVATGLAHACSRGVTHRDIKPSNIIITPEGRAKIVDMGLARSTDAHGGVTQSGVTLGTFDYISPEQAIEPRSADVRSDLYSLGCTFYHLLTGQPPVPEGTAAKKLHHHQHVPPIDPRELNPAIPDEVALVLGKMMAKEPRDRYQRPEQLIQHLLIVAQKLRLAGDSSSQEAMLFVDAPLPSPSRVSPVLAAVAAIAAVAIIAVILGVGAAPTNTPNLPSQYAQAKGPMPANTPSNAAPNSPNRVEREPHVAATSEQLIKLLADANVSEIILTGDLYEFGDSGFGPIDSDQAARPIVVRRGIRLIGQSRGPNSRPILRWRTPESINRDRDVPSGLFTFEPTSVPARVELQNLRIELSTQDDGAKCHAIVAQGLGALRVVDCEFIHVGKRSAMTPGGAIRFEGAGLVASQVELQRCYFAGGTCAIDAMNRAEVKARDCAFAPHDVVIRFSERAVPATSSPNRVLADLSHCTVLMKEGTIFQAENNVEGTILAADCVFGRGEFDGAVTLIRQKDRSSQLTFARPESSPRSRNVYFGIDFWSTPSSIAASPDDCRRLGLAFHDADAAVVPTDRSPWESPQPLRLLGSPKKAFALSVKRNDLRTADRLSMVGVESGAWGNLYDRLPVLDDAPEAAANVVIVDPSQATNERERQFKTLKEAWAALGDGQQTILIRKTGILEIEPLTVTRAKSEITIRPEGKHRPVLALADYAEALNAMFLIRNGSIAFKDMQFRLIPAENDGSKWISVVHINGIGQCTFDDCIATLDTNDSTQPALVTLTGDSEAAASEKKIPEIVLNNSIVRGRGHLAAVRGSRPFKLVATNVLAALRGSFLHIVGQTKELPLNSGSQVVCKHVTACLAEPFLELQSSEERKVVGLAPTSVKCDDCLLVSTADRGLIGAVGVDRDSLTKNLLRWEGSRNLFGNYTRYVEFKSGTAMAMMNSDWTERDWVAFSNESSDSFARVSFNPTPSDADWPKALPSQFTPKLFDMKRTEVNGSVFGAMLSQLPRAAND